MNRVFYIFRHGETDWNKERRCQGHTNIPLNETGLSQARLLASRFVDFPLEIVVSSDLDRARMTGMIVAETKGIPIILDPRLREMHYGTIEGLTYEAAVELHGSELWEKLKCFKPENDLAGFPGGETRAQTKVRFLEAIHELMEKYPYQHIGISTHGGVLRNVVHHFLPEDFPMIEIPNCVIYKIIYNTQSRSFKVNPKPL